jgi:hypothetical protein
MLYNALLAGAGIGWSVMPGDNRAMDFILKNLKRIHSGQFPEATQHSTPEPFQYHLFQQGERFTLELLDVPGEVYEKIGDDPRYKIVEYLLSCKGIIFLIDPNRAESATGSDSYRTLFLNLMTRLQMAHSDMNNPLLQQLMAFCVTIVDQDDLWDRRDTGEDLVREIIGVPAYRVIRGLCQPGNFKFFTLSSVGRYRDPSSNCEQSNVACPVAPQPSSSMMQPSHTSPVKRQSGVMGPGNIQPEASPLFGHEPVDEPQASLVESLTVPQAAPAIIRPELINSYRVNEPLEWLITHLSRGRG